MDQMGELADFLQRPDWTPTPDAHAALLSEADALCALAQRLRSEPAGEGYAVAVARFHDRLDAYLAVHELYRRRMGTSGATMPDPLRS